jgi:hypothetical protein
MSDHGYKYDVEKLKNDSLFCNARGCWYCIITAGDYTMPSVIILIGGIVTLV